MHNILPNSGSYIHHLEREARHIAAVCRDRELVISMVADDAALNHVVLDPGGVRDSLADDAIHVAMGTHSAGAIQSVDAALKGKGLAFVAAPVLGNPDFGRLIRNVNGTASDCEGQ